MRPEQPILSLRRRGFSLVELMIASALSMIIMGVVMFAFHNASKASSAALNSINLNQKAQAILTQFESDFAAIQPTSKIRLESDFIYFARSVDAADADYDPATTNNSAGQEWVWYKFNTGFLSRGTTAWSGTTKTLTASADNTLMDGISEGSFHLHFVTTADDDLGTAKTIGPLKPVEGYNTGTYKAEMEKLPHFIRVKFRITEGVGDNTRGLSVQRQFRFPGGK